jgi:hypothetical protein
MDGKGLMGWFGCPMLQWTCSIRVLPTHTVEISRDSAHLGELFPCSTVEPKVFEDFVTIFNADKRTHAEEHLKAFVKTYSETQPLLGLRESSRWLHCLRPS